MYRSLFSRDAFGDLDRLQREMNTLFDLSPGIRGLGHVHDHGNDNCAEANSTCSGIRCDSLAPSSASPIDSAPQHGGIMAGPEASVGRYRRSALDLPANAHDDAGYASPQ